MQCKENCARAKGIIDGIRTESSARKQFGRRIDSTRSLYVTFQSAESNAKQSQQIAGHRKTIYESQGRARRKS